MTLKQNYAYQATGPSIYIIDFNHSFFLKKDVYIICVLEYYLFAVNLTFFHFSWKISSIIKSLRVSQKGDLCQQHFTLEDYLDIGKMLQSVKQ